MEEKENRGDKRSFTPVIWFQAHVNVSIQHRVTGDLNRIVGYEIISYSDMRFASALYYLADGAVWCEDFVWETYVEIEEIEDQDEEDSDF